MLNINDVKLFVGNNAEVIVLNNYIDEDKTFYGVRDADEIYMLYSIGNELYNDFGSIIFIKK